jgi:hypothetical protein
MIRSAVATGLVGAAGLLANPPAHADPPHRLDVELPPAPAQIYGHGSDPQSFRKREPGTNTVLYVNFDGIELGDCNPSNSKKNCHWYNHDPIPAFSGPLTEQVSVLQAMRRHADAYGIRITGVRPPSDVDYTMVIYGGTEAQYGALGSAPAGDCFDENPNEIAFAHLDGELAGWVTAGSTTALHEAAHTWGLDHVDLQGEIMFPSGDNSPTSFDDDCLQIVADTDLKPGGESCPELNDELCEQGDRQNSTAVLTELFGARYVDVQPPIIHLREPEDGEYFQGPADFEVVLELQDDLHPQQYAMWAWYGDGARPDDAQPTVAPGFSVVDLPVGSWSFHVIVADEAGNESRLDFEVEVGLDPPPDPAQPSSCACGPLAPPSAWLAMLPVVLARPRRRR